MKICTVLIILLYSQNISQIFYCINLNTDVKRNKYGVMLDPVFILDKNHCVQ